MMQTLMCYALSFATVLPFWIWTLTVLNHVVLSFIYLGVTIYLCFLLAGILDCLLPRRRVSSTNKAVFITGCDTGFGNQLAKRLDSSGFKVFAGCLMPNGPDAEQLQKSSSSNITIIHLDVTSDKSVHNALRTVEEGLKDSILWAVVNNAGIILRGEAEWTLLEDYKKEFEVNTFGVVRVTQSFLPLLRKFKGRVVTTASFAGRYTFSGEVPYSMSKHATCSFCDGLRVEMEKWGVKVITVEPFSYRSAMTDVREVMDSVERTWSRAPDHIKETYGAEYVYESKKVIVKFNENATSSKTSEVVDCLEEAVTARSPHYSYTPGNLKSILAFWFIRRVPQTLANRIVTRFVTFDDEIKKYMNNRIKGR